MLAILAKDLRVEIRTREILTTAGFFAVLVAVLTSFAFHAGTETTQRIAPGAIWLAVAFASILALSRTWQRERDDGALTALLVSPVPRMAIFLGKALGVFAFVTAIELLVVPVVALLFHIDLPEAAPVFALLLFMGTIGISATGTLFGAMTARTSARDLVLAAVLFPLLSPTLICGIAGMREALIWLTTGRPIEMDEIQGYLLLLGVTDFVAVGAGIGLFGALMGD